MIHFFLREAEVGYIKEACAVLDQLREGFGWRERKYRSVE
jgi:hypothetical protein